ncbi:hypothetical protein E3N88_12851 [Mikania micrantha]|uniref:Uncharacterized protein n=1 Tax=Mikania micrantha TaxID=192012 RepID=A0A5N6P8I5_9ASTR|nr:hypothetical protein E3N88_12851 [Mikania micrantha]
MGLLGSPGNLSRYATVHMTLSRYATSGGGNLNAEHPRATRGELLNLSRYARRLSSQNLYLTKIWKPLLRRLKLKNIEASLLDHHPSPPSSYSLRDLLSRNS